MTKHLIAVFCRENLDAGMLQFEVQLSAEGLVATEELLMAGKPEPLMAMPLLFLL